MDLQQLTGLLTQAENQYPFISQYNPVVTSGSGEGYAETWFPHDFGPTGTERPADIPAESLGIEIRKPEQFNPHDLAGEVLHIDPISNRVRTILNSSLSPQQWDVLKDNALDYEESLKYGLPEERARENTIDSAIRGYAVNQWPEQINKEMQYTKEQQALLDALKYYMQTGKEPSSPTLKDVYKGKE